MKYEVIVDSDLETLEAKVTDRLNNGWKLQGGITTSVSVFTGWNSSSEQPTSVESSTFYLQAMYFGEPK